MSTRCLILFCLIQLSMSFAAIGQEQNATRTASTGVSSFSPERNTDLRAKIDKIYPALDALYKHLHAHAELSLHEEQTAARLAKELREVGCEVTTGIGGHGVVGLLKNGAGPTVMVRADMDALPITEKTGLSYASKVRTRDREGNEVGVMHACGHDVNVTCLVGLGQVFAQTKSQWRGTLMLIGQPAEEIGAGARAMLADRLFERFGRPDYAFALHCDAKFPHGTVNFREGLMQANVDSVDILVQGKGAHGAAPHLAVDPIVLGCKIVLDLQTIVSREMNPIDPAVVTVGSFHAGTKHNIIPNEAKLQITVRTTSSETRQRVLDSIARIAKGAAQTMRAPEPIIRVDPAHFTPALENNSDLTRKTVALFRQVLGEEKVLPRPMSMGGEDFSQFVRAGIPGFYFHLGTADPKLWEEVRRGGPALAGTHTDAYYPIPEPTIKTGVLSMSWAVLSILGR